MSRMCFRNYGGDYQLRIEEPDDLENVVSLDEVHWAAMSAPISGLNSDPAFLTFLDADRNARIRTDEVKAGVEWLFRMLANRSHLAEQTDVLKLADIDTSHPEGKQLHAASELILSNLKVLEYYEISLSQVRDLKNILASAANNGDGVIPPDATDDPDLRAFITAIADSIGSAPDASGQNGITADHLNTFMNESKAYIEWEAKGHIPTGNESTGVMPWGNATTSAWQLICGVDEKIEQYFTLCDVVRFDSRTAQELELQKMKLDDVDFSDRAVLEAKLSDSPIAPPSPDGIVDLAGELNPFFEKRLCDLRESVLKRALGESVAKINREEWQKVKSVFSAYQAWLNGKRGGKGRETRQGSAC